MRQYNQNDNVFPEELEEKYNYIRIDSKVITTLFIVGYPVNIQMFQIFDELNNIGENEMSIHIKKQDKADFLKNLTKIIASSKEELISTHENRIDSDTLNNKINTAKKMRHAIQVENEDIYQITMYLTIVANNVENLKFKQKEIVNYMYAKQIILKPANFRQKEAYLAGIPLNYNNKKAENSAIRFVTSSTLALLFPYYTNNVFEKNGIIIGQTKAKLCVYDIFSDNHSNYNMTILGSSGSGKSYFVKLMILRNKYMGRKQIVFDPEGEYEDIVKIIGGRIIKPDKHNFLYIEENFIKQNPENFIYLKVELLLKQILEIQEIEDSLLSIIKEKIIKLYLDNGINGSIENMYMEEGEKVIYIKKKYMDYNKFPNITILIEEIKKSKDVKKDKQQQIIKILSKIDCKKMETGIEKSDLILFNLKGCVAEKFKEYMNIFFIGMDEYKEYGTIVYIDEIWKCVSFGSDEKLTTKIFNMFKTLRKEKMGIVSITQDVTDFFTYKEGLFGKSILNNSYNKVIFSLNYVDTEEFAKIINQTKEQINRIKMFERGKAFIQMGNSNFELKVGASEWEHELIEGSCKK